MNFSVDFLYLCLFFPLWVCMLIFCNSALFSLKSRRVATAGTIFGCGLTMLIMLIAFIKNFSYENNILLFAVNDIGIHIGIYVNKLNSILLLIASFFIAVSSVLTFFKYKNESFFYKYMFLANLLLFSVTCFFMSSNLLQMYIFFAVISSIFYILENLTNASHERAKNFLVLSKIGDFTLLIPVCLLFYYDSFFKFESNDIILKLSDLKNTFFGIQSICDTNIFLLICTLTILAIFIKTILIFIHPLKLKTNVLLLAGICITMLIYWIKIINPLFYYFGNLKLITICTAFCFLIIATVTIYLKKFEHDFVVKINSLSYNFVKKLYFKIANCVNFFDKNVLDKCYENIAKLMMMISGGMKITSDKNTLFALIFNIIGILFLIFTAWIIYNFTLKG